MKKELLSFYFIMIIFAVSYSANSRAQESAPILDSVTRDSNDNYTLSFHMPSSSRTPNGFDTHINGVNQNDWASYSGSTHTVSGLDPYAQQCFQVKSRYLDTYQFLLSNEICVAAKVEAALQEAAPVLNSVNRDANDNYILSFQMPSSAKMPDGFDTHINGVNQNDWASYSGSTHTISGLDPYIEQCFEVKSRYLDTYHFYYSNEVCVSAKTVTVSGQELAPILDSVARDSGDNYILTFHMPSSAKMPDGFDTHINGVNQDDWASYSGSTHTVSGLDPYTEQCFQVKSRYLDTYQFLLSSEICVAAKDQGNTGGNNGSEDNQNHPVAGAYYVSTSGSSSNSGLNSNSPWTLAKALSSINAGDTVYVRAGNYGSQNLTISRSGTTTQPIRIIGYRNTPGDIQTTTSASVGIGGQVNSSLMPLLEGSSYGGIAMSINASNITLENFQVNRYSIGILSKGQSNKFKNIVSTNQGNQNSNGYDGFGIRVEATNNVIENSYVANSTAEAIRLSSADNSIIRYTKVYANNATSPTDYYIVINGGTRHALVEYAEVRRASGLSHGGHGIILKDLAEYNTIRKSKIYLTDAEVNFSGVRYNVFEDLEIYGNGKGSENWPAKIMITNGANNNTFRNILIKNVWNAIHFREYDDGFVAGDADRDAASLGHDNKFYNIVVQNANRVINADGSGNLSTATHDRNYFYNSTFQNVDRLAVNYYRANDIRFYNCVIDTVSDGLVYEAGGSYAPYSQFDVSFYNTNFSNVSSGIPTGTNITTYNPHFVNAASGDLRLQSYSNLVNRGQNTSYNLDFNGVLRPSGSFDLGAFER